MPTAPLLLIDVGDLPSLVAAMIQPEGGRLVLFHPQRPDGCAAARLAVLREHERIIRPAGITFGKPGTVSNPANAVPIHMQWLSELAVAASAAIDAGCGTVIWPVQIGIDSEGVGKAMETAQLVGDICGLAEADGEGLHFKLPLVDRTDREIALLAEEVGVPARAFWPCEESGSEPCERCSECRRWMVAFGSARAEWPWAKSSVR
jgi:hypothetical protein